MTIQSALQSAYRTLASVSTSPTLDAEVLLAFVLKQPQSFLFIYPEQELTTPQQAAFDAAIAKRSTSYPVAYITHEKEFYGRPFFVDERVLIPRPETEMLIDEVTVYLRTSRLSSPTIVDLCTGSGCISVTLKKEHPSARVVASDISPDALVVAKQNAEKHEAEIEYVVGDLFTPLPEELKGKIDVIVSNPPYVDLRSIYLSSKESSSVQYEPLIAVTPLQANGAPHPNAAHFVEEIITQAVTWVRAGGLLVMELGSDQAASAAAHAQQAFPNARVTILPDLSGNNRVLKITS